MGGALTEVFTFPTSAFLVGELTLAQVMCVCVWGGGPPNMGTQDLQVCPFFRKLV